MSTRTDLPADIVKITGRSYFAQRIAQILIEKGYLMPDRPEPTFTPEDTEWGDLYREEHDSEPPIALWNDDTLSDFWIAVFSDGSTSGGFTSNSSETPKSSIDGSTSGGFAEYAVEEFDGLSAQTLLSIGSMMIMAGRALEKIEDNKNG